MSLFKSKQRVADHGEVFTPAWMVEAMLNLVKDETERIKRDYETETGYQIVEAMNGRSYREIEMILLPSHGPYTWGETPEAAVYNAVVLEELAKTALLTFMIEPHAPVIDPALAEKHFLRKHGKDKYYGQD
jgi:L-ribulose-5-phosphate 4-epimerase